MAAFISNFKLAHTLNGGVARTESSDDGGKLRYMVSSYTVTATAHAIADTINFGTLPKGARVLGNLSKLYWATGAASSTLAIGDGTTSGKFLAATAVTTAGGAIMEAANASGALFKTTAETDVIGTIAGAALQTGQVITAHIVYVQD